MRWWLFFAQLLRPYTSILNCQFSCQNRPRYGKWLASTYVKQPIFLGFLRYSVSRMTSSRLLFCFNNTFCIWHWNIIWKIIDCRYPLSCILALDKDKFSKRAISVAYKQLFVWKIDFIGWVHQKTNKKWDFFATCGLACLVFIGCIKIEIINL